MGTVGQTQFKMPSTTVFLAASAAVSCAFAQTVPESAQIVDQKSFNVLPNVPPPSGANASTLFVWPGVTEESLSAKPFHIYDEEFYDVIGDSPSLPPLQPQSRTPSSMRLSLGTLQLRKFSSFRMLVLLPRAQDWTSLPLSRRSNFRMPRK